MEYVKWLCLIICFSNNLFVIGAVQVVYFGDASRSTFKRCSNFHYYILSSSQWIINNISRNYFYLRIFSSVKNFFLFCNGGLIFSHFFS